MTFDKKPKVSVITVCFNSGKYIERAIQSVLYQSYRHIEYVVVDGKSTDRTLKILDKYRDRIDCLISEPDDGIYDAMNKGIKLATGDILYFLNSDDQIYNSDSIERVVNFFEKKEVDFIYCNMVCYNPTSLEVYTKNYPRILTKRYFLRGPLGHAATLFHKDCFKKAGHFNAKYKISGDYEWYLRALFKYGLRGVHINEIFSIFQEGGTSSQESVLLSEMKLVQKLYFSPFELFIGKCVNFLSYGDIFRILARLVFRKKWYGVFRSWYRRLSSRKYYTHVMKKT